MFRPFLFFGEWIETTSKPVDMVYETIIEPNFNWYYAFAIFFLGVFSERNIGIWMVPLVIFSLYFLMQLKGITVDLKSGRYRDFIYWPGNFRRGKWNSIETHDFLLLSRNVKGDFIAHQLHLITNGSRDLLVYQSKKEDLVWHEASVLSEVLGIKVFDLRLEGLTEVVP